jgi:hypothetical protein
VRDLRQALEQPAFCYLSALPFYCFLANGESLVNWLSQPWVHRRYVSLSFY